MAVLSGKSRVVSWLPGEWLVGRLGNASKMKSPRRNPWGWMTNDRVTYALKVLGIVVLALYAGQFLIAFCQRIRTVVYILIAAIFLAYLIYPGVQWLRRRVSLLAAITIVYATIVIVLVLVGYFVLPNLGDDVGQLVRHYPDLVHRFRSLVYDPNDPVTSRLPVWVRNEISQIPGQIGAWIRIHGFQTFGQVVYVLLGTVAAVVTFIIVPLVTAYLLMDVEGLKRGLQAVIPPGRWTAALALLTDIDHVIGGFIRGQLLVALIVGVLITIAMAILRVPYPYLLGLIAAVGDLIPYVGAVLAFIPAFVSSALNNGWINAAVVTAAFVAIFQAEGHLIAPNIVSRTVKLSPFVVIVALLVGGDLGGLVGLLVAVPIAGVLRVIALRVFPPPDANEAQP
jgi:predicted PurR-regulated permease PerM